MEISKFLPQGLLLLFFANMMIQTIKAYQKHKSVKTETNLHNLIFALAFILLMLVWGGFFTPINQW